MLKFLNKLYLRLQVRIGHAKNAEECKFLKEIKHFKKLFTE
jgi:hypothetical protein